MSFVVSCGQDFLSRDVFSRPKAFKEVQHASAEKSRHVVWRPCCTAQEQLFT